MWYLKVLDRYREAGPCHTCSSRFLHPRASFPHSTLIAAEMITVEIYTSEIKLSVEVRGHCRNIVSVHDTPCKTKLVVKVA